MPRIIVRDALRRRPTLEHPFADSESVAEVRAFAAEKWEISPALFFESRLLGDETDLRLLSEEATFHMEAIALSQDEGPALALDVESSAAAEKWLLERRSEALEMIAGGEASAGATVSLESIESVANALEELSEPTKGIPAEAPGAPPPAPAPQVAAAPRQWLSLGLLLRLAVSTFFMLQRPSRARVYSISLAVALHVLEVSGLGLVLLAGLKSLVVGGVHSHCLAEQAQALESWVARGCPVPAPGPQRGIVSESMCVAQAFVFSLAPR